MKSYEVSTHPVLEFYDFCDFCDVCDFYDFCDFCDFYDFCDFCDFYDACEYQALMRGLKIWSAKDVIKRYNPSKIVTGHQR